MKALLVGLLLTVLSGLSLLFAPAAPVARADTSQYRTPGNHRAVIFDPFALDLNLRLNNQGNRDNTDDARTQKDEPVFYQPAEVALKNEGYDVTTYANASKDQLDAPPATTETVAFTGSSLLNFDKTSGAGVAIFISHGRHNGSDAQFIVECHSNPAETDAEMNDIRHTRGALAKAKWTDKEVGPTTATTTYWDPKTERRVEATVHCLYINEQGVKDHWRGNHSLVYLVVCHSENMAIPFMSVGADNVFAYKGQYEFGNAASDLRTFWTDMDGTKHKGEQPDTSKRRDFANAFEECCSSSPGDDRGPIKARSEKTGAQWLVLAPSVYYRSPVPQSGVGITSTVTVVVTFNAPLKTERVVPTTVLTADGCGARHVPAPAGKPDGWSDNGRTLTGYFQIDGKAGSRSIAFTVHSGGKDGRGGLARSQYNEVSLDGNQLPTPPSPIEKYDGPFGPNGDDYTWTVHCTGTLPSGNTPDNGGGSTTDQHKTPTETPTETPKPNSASTTGVLKFSVPSLAFAAQAAGTSSAAQTITATNEGSGPVTLTSVSLEGAAATSFSLQDSTCSGVIGGGGSCSLQVVFRPGGAESDTASLVFVDDGPGSPLRLPISGTGIAVPTPTVTPPAITGTPALTVSASSLMFSLADQQQKQSLTITNTGTAATAVTVELSGSAFVMVGTDCNGLLAPQAVCHLALAYVGGSNAGASATLTLPYPGGSVSVALQFTPQPAQPTQGLTAVPASVSFNAEVGQVDTQATTLLNGLDQPIIISTLQVDPQPPFSSSPTSTCSAGLTLPAGGTCTLHIWFSPSAAGEYPGSVQISYITPDGTSGVLGIPLSGHAAHQLGSTTVTFSPTSLVFDAVQPGIAHQLTLTVTNSGQVPLRIASITTAPDTAPAFSIAGNTCGTTLAAGQSCTVDVRFDPQSGAMVTGALVFADSGAGGPHVVALQGSTALPPTSTPTTTPTPIVPSGPNGVLSTTQLDFGNVNLGTTSAPKAVTLTNTGDAALIFSSAPQITGDSGYAIVANTCQQALAPGAHCEVDVTLTPNDLAGQTLYALLTFNDNAPYGIKTVVLGGRETPTS